MKTDRATPTTHTSSPVPSPSDRVSSAWARSWKAYRTDDPEIHEPPTLALYCPECAAREFRRSQDG